MAEVACGKRSGEFELTVRRRSSNKDSNGNQLRRVPDEDDEVPARLCTGVLFVRTAVQSKSNYGLAGYSATSRRSFAGNSRGEHCTRREEHFCFRENGGGLAGRGQHASQRAGAGRPGRRFGTERGLGLFDQGGEARWRSAADRVGIDIWKNPIAGAENHQARREI